MNAKRPKILAVHSGALGDCILFVRLLERLGGQVTLVCCGAKGGLLSGLGAVDGTLNFDILPIHEVFSQTSLVESELPRILGRHDRLVSCFAGGDRRAELRLAAACEAETAAFLPVRPEEAFAGHLVELWADLLGLDRPDLSKARPWPVPGEWKKNAARMLSEIDVAADEPYVVIHPGAGGRRKCWPLERFESLGARSGRAVFVLGPVEVDRWSAEAVSSLGEKFPLLLCPELETLAGVLAEATAFVGNDAGVSHLAAAVGAATVALFGPTRGEHFAPIGPTVRIVAKERIDSISLERVTEALAEAMGE